MAVPKNVPTDEPNVSEAEIPSSSGHFGLVGQSFHSAQSFQCFKVAFLGRIGSGKNSLAWRIGNLNDSELPAVPSLPRREIVLELSSRPSLRHNGVFELNIRIVPPEDSDHAQPFFHRKGEVSECGAVVFVVDLGDEKSSDEFYKLFKKVKKHTTRMPPFLIVGNKVDLRLFGVVTPHRWGENTASLYKAQAYLECSAKTNDRVGEVLDAILRIALN